MTVGQFKILLPGVPAVTSRGYLGYCSVVLFDLGGEPALFDVGHQADRAKLVEALREEGLTPGEIRHVVLSHLHFDHALNLSLFPRAAVYLSRAELDYAAQVAAGRLVDHSLADFPDRLLAGRAVTTVDRALDLGGGLTLRLWPGHTPGCLALHGRAGVVLAGDVIKNAWEAVTGEASMALAGPNQARASIQGLLAGAEIIVPGHDRPFRRAGAGVAFLADLAWRVRLSLYPHPRDQVVLDLGPAAGPGEM